MSEKLNDIEKLRILYAKAVSLLCECAPYMDDERREGISAVASEFCDSTGWRWHYQEELKNPEHHSRIDSYKIVLFEPVGGGKK